MNAQTRRLLVVVLTGVMIIVGLSTWGVVRVVGWVKELPHRIEVDGDAIADALQTAVVQSYHQALTSGDAETQHNVMQEFSELATDNAAFKDWIRAEYSEDLRRIASSDDAALSADAKRLLEQIDL